MADMMTSKISGAKTQTPGVLREVKSSGPSFAETLTSQAETAAENLISKEQAGGAKLPAEKLSAQTFDPSKSTKPILKFSNHALERMNTRGISFSSDQITKIEQGMQKASDKGAKETLVLTDDSALIVSLKNNMVVTVMDKGMLRENVFTNIDSTVFV